MFLCCVFNTKTKEKRKFEISERVNEYEQLVRYFTDDTLCHVGYNSLNYDSPIVTNLVLNRSKFRDASYLEITQDCFRLSNDIINLDGQTVKHLRYAMMFEHIDLLTMLFSRALRVSLKEMEITMCYHNVKEMIMHWNEPLPASRIDELIDYCFNDVGATTSLLVLCQSDLRLRTAIEAEFGIECMSKDGVGIGVDIFTKFVCEDLEISRGQLFSMVKVPEVIRVGELILPIIHFKTPAFKAVLRWYQNMVINVETGESEGLSKKKEALLGKLVHTFALGGLHSQNTPMVHVSDEQYTIRDLDVASYYPALIIEWGFVPSYIAESFLRVMTRIRTLRLAAKKAKDKNKDLTFKLAMNSISGNYKNPYSPVYAPDANVAMCVNGQLLIAMLIEDMELARFECIASNTDGATFKVQNGREQEFNSIRDAWETMSRMTLEETVYEKMVIVAVNDYIAFKEGYSAIKDQLHFHSPKDSIKLNETPVKLTNDITSQLREKYVKEKGMFITSPRIGKGMDQLIVAKALQNYFGRGIPVQATIMGSKHIWDFVKFERVGRQFDVYWNDQEQQRTNRFYVSKRGAYLYKVKTLPRFDKGGHMYNAKSYSHVVKGRGVTLLNECYEGDIRDHEIDYSYYIKEANEVIREIEPSQMELF